MLDGPGPRPYSVTILGRGPMCAVGPTGSRYDLYRAGSKKFFELPGFRGVGREGKADARGVTSAVTQGLFEGSGPSVESKHVPGDPGYIWQRFWVLRKCDGNGSFYRALAQQLCGLGCTVVSGGDSRPPAPTCQLYCWKAAPGKSVRPLHNGNTGLSARCVCRED